MGWFSKRKKYDDDATRAADAPGQAAEEEVEEDDPRWEQWAEARNAYWNGIGTLDEAEQHLGAVDGVMLGRAAYHTPALLGEVDRRLFGVAGEDVDSFRAVELYRPYVERELAAGTHLAAITRHMLGLFHGLPGARAWRRILTVEGVKAGAGMAVIDAALAEVLRAQDERRARGLEAGQAA